MTSSLISNVFIEVHEYEIIYITNNNVNVLCLTINLIPCLVH